MGTLMAETEADADPNGACLANMGTQYWPFKSVCHISTIRYDLRSASNHFKGKYDPVYFAFGTDVINPFC